MGKNYIDIENDHGEMLRYRKHVNGRGLVAHGAKVHPSALVENGAYVEPGVQIAAGVRVGRGAWIESDAVIGPEARIEPHAHICAGAVIGAGAHIGVRTQVGHNARIASGFAHRRRRDHQRRGSRRHRPTGPAPGGVSTARRAQTTRTTLRSVRVFVCSGSPPARIPREAIPPCPRDSASAGGTPQRQAKIASTSPISGSVPWIDAGRRYLRPEVTSTSAAATIEPQREDQQRASGHVADAVHEPEHDSDERADGEEQVVEALVVGHRLGDVGRLLVAIPKVRHVLG